MWAKPGECRVTAKCIGSNFEICYGNWRLRERARAKPDNLEMLECHQKPLNIAANRDAPRMRSCARQLNLRTHTHYNNLTEREGLVW